ncbi:DUF6291 domain-containing protein [uncultured Duncaniella sp.]|uniref:DUF6291 domain-containing protein n=1 Tax=uncultured Duncaniella sp. TaxID=2768039 RepID=UPI00272D8160|nr:DUF6291 domain-containing protein [uncultured Duncaniella sp.]
MPNEIKRDSFILYRSFVDIIRDLEGEQAKTFLLAISDYSLDGKEPVLQGFLNTLWKPVKPQLDANIRRYENGKKGGAPKGSRNNSNGRRGKQNISDKPTNESLSSQNTTTSKPTLEQVRAYVSEQHLSVDPDKFFYYYEGRGWKIGNTEIAKWEALIHSWLSKDASKTTPSTGLGVGEHYDSNGNRICGLGDIAIPQSAPPRPSPGHWWNETTNQWESLI